MNPATQPKSGNPSLLPLRTESPTRLLGKAGAILKEGILVIEVSLYWALVFVLAGCFWLGNAISFGIETLIGSARSGASAPSAHHTTAGGQVTVNLVIVLAVITAAVGTLAYEWHHAQAAKPQQRSLVAHHMKYLVKRDAPH
jgi:hypothetical protein